MTLPITEFEIISKYFKARALARKDVALGIGDDAALIQVPSNQLLVVSIDTLVEGVHFSVGSHPADIGYKSLAVNLSDLAAMGADPAWMTLALTLPNADAEWLDQFACGLFELANEFNVQLVGGDVTRGPLTITIEAHGLVPPDQAIKRSGAKPGDKIYVSGTLGDAALGLRVVRGECELPDYAKEKVLQALHRPSPQIKLGILLRGLGTSAIDVSDGLLADLGHILEASKVGAEIIANEIPLSDVLRKFVTIDDALQLALTSGDDYQLCFTVSPDNENYLLTTLRKEHIATRYIGVVTEELGLKMPDCHIDFSKSGYTHF